MDKVETGKIEKHKAAIAHALAESDTVKGFTEKHSLGNIYMRSCQVIIHPVVVRDYEVRDEVEDFVENLENDELTEIHRELVERRKNLRHELEGQRSEYIEGMIDAFDEIEKELFQKARNQDDNSGD